MSLDYWAGFRWEWPCARAKPVRRAHLRFILRPGVFGATLLPLFMCLWSEARFKAHGGAGYGGRDHNHNYF